jgi:hypothetical protein
MTARGERPAPSDPAADATARRLWGGGAQYNRLACGALVVLLGVVYLTTLYPGVASGDSAELQYMCPLLGVCHPPGYAIEVVVGKLFSLLPIGPNIAWRINFMQSICGIVGGLALYGAIRRLTGQILPALVGATTLAFSTIYWSHSVAAEVYVFYGMFLLLGIYTAVRFLASDKARWLYLTALFLGICIGSRPSELFVLPALAGLWLGMRGRARLSPLRIGLSVLVAVLPFVFTVCFYVAREDPRLLHARDDALRDRILGLGTPFPERPLAERLREAFVYSTGLGASQREKFTRFSLDQLAWDAKKYGWLLSGGGAFHDRFPRRDPRVDFDGYLLWREQGQGTSVGALGLLLALAGLWAWRWQRGGLLLGLGLFLGNLVFYFCMHPVDNLQFTIPGLAGLAVLVGLGAARRPAGRDRRWSLVYPLACFVVPVFLLVTNYRYVDPMTPETREHLELGQLVKETPLPNNPVIIGTYSRVHTLRCLYWIDAGRTDVRVLIYRERFEGDELLRLVRTLRQRGYAVLFSSEAITKEDRKRVLAGWTPRELVDVGLFWAYPRGPGARHWLGE